MGEFVRVSGLTNAVVITGTITARIVYDLDGTPNFTAFHRAAVTCYDGGVELSLARSGSWELGHTGWLQLLAWAVAPDHQDSTSVEYPGGDEVVSLPFSITVTGMALKRRLNPGGNDHRGGLHPFDCTMQDAWYATPGFRTVVALGDVSYDSGERRERPEYAGLTDAQIGDVWVGDPVVTVGIELGGRENGDWWCLVEVDQCDFSGVDVAPVGGDSGDAPISSHRVTGSGAVLTAAATMTGNHAGSVQPFSATVAGFTKLAWAWDAGCRLFESGETLDPDVWAGFLASDGTPRKTALSALPGDTGAISPVGIIRGENHSVFPVDLRGANPTFAVSIDEEWALRNLLCGDEPVEYIEGEAIETQSDRTITLSIPGVDHGVGSPWYTPVGLSVTEPELLPLVARRGHPEVVPWTSSAAPVTIDGAHPTRWTVPSGAPAARVTAALQTDYWTDLAKLPQLDVEKDWDAPRRLRRREGEDLFSWRDTRFAALRWLRTDPLTGPGTPRALTLTLQVDYRTVEVYDPHITHGAERAAEYEITEAAGVARYTFTLPAGQADHTVMLDLLAPDAGGAPYLYVVDRLTVELPGNPDGPAYQIDLASLKLVADPGRDHHGRTWTPAPRSEVKCIETPDFLTDYEGLYAQRDGNLLLNRLPDEPNVGGRPERGVGYIQKLRGWPSGLFMDTPRPLDSAGILGCGDCLRLQVSPSVVDGMLKSFWKGSGSPEVLGPSWLAWLGNEMHELGPGTFGLTAAITARSWSIARGVQPTLTLRKVLGGAARGLLLDDHGWPLVPDAELHGAYEIVLWWRAARYYARTFTSDAGSQVTHDTDVAAPSGLPAAGQWQFQWQRGLLSQVDPHGVLTVGGLRPSHTRVWNPARGSDPAAMIDRAELEYCVQVWAGHGWAAYDVNAAHEAMLADPSCQGEWLVSGVKARRYVPLAPSLGALQFQGGNLVRLRIATQLITRGGHVWRRLGGRGSWHVKRSTTAELPLLVNIPTSDEVALIDDQLSHTKNHGLAWVTGAPPGLPAVVAAWRAAGRLTEARMAPKDLQVMAVGVKPGGAGLFAVGRRGDLHVAHQVSVADFDPADRLVWPWTYRLPDGHWIVGCFTGGQYRQWRSTDVDGQAWQAGEASPGPANLTGCSFWRGREGLELVAGYSPSLARIEAWSRGGPGSVWGGPYLCAAAPRTMPYAYVRRTGPLEIGWLVSDAWVRYEADRADTDWSLIHE